MGIATAVCLFSVLLIRSIRRKPLRKERAQYQGAESNLTSGLLAAQWPGTVRLVCLVPGSSNNLLASNFQAEAIMCLRAAMRTGGLLYCESSLERVRWSHKGKAQLQKRMQKCRLVNRPYSVEGPCGPASLVTRRTWPPAFFTLSIEATATSSLVMYLKQ